MGDLTMDGVNYTFSAPQVADPAGHVHRRTRRCARLLGGASRRHRHRRAVHGGITGRDFEQAELQQLKEQQFRDQVRNKRILQQAAQLHLGTLRSTINGRPVAAYPCHRQHQFG